MDTTDYPSLSQLARLNAQLARNSARVESIVTAQLDSVERLFRAVTSRDWDAVARVSDEIARRPPPGESESLVRSARQVSDALRRDPTGAKAASRLAALLDACRAAKSRRTAS